jgi:hypothetical protein
VRASKKELHEQSPAGAVSCYALARDLAGTFKGLPKDPADNPKYMGGFGNEGKRNAVRCMSGWTFGTGNVR